MSVHGEKKACLSLFPHVFSSFKQTWETAWSFPRFSHPCQAAVAAMGFHEDPGFDAGSARVPLREASRAAQQKPPRTADVARHVERGGKAVTTATYIDSGIWENLRKCDG